MFFGILEELYYEPSDPDSNSSSSDSDSEFNSDSDKTSDGDCIYSAWDSEKYLKKLLKSQVRIKLKRNKNKVKEIVSCKFCKKEFDILKSETGDCYYRKCLNYSCDECTLIIKCTKCDK